MRAEPLAEILVTLFEHLRDATTDAVVLEGH